MVVGPPAGSNQIHPLNHPTVLFLNGSGVERLGKREFAQGIKPIERKFSDTFTGVERK